MTSINADAIYHFRAASAAVINRILTRYSVSSSASRVTQAGEVVPRRHSHNGVSVAKVINRGGWAFDAASRVFMYFSGVGRGDMRVGRVVAGWTDSDHGGVPFSAKALEGPEDQVLFAAFASKLFERYLSIYPSSLLDALAASAVGYYNDVSRAAALR
ncbi:hypothetical protein PybrP1_009305 [[Pythium] brassicae (nom. inval.)]|nr:hypothetical protein PybrP1_009305 [[Pythium] brassicae (nom. inval.)]